jgi:HEAT repeat protein
LIAAISNKRLSDDVRREAARTLGLIGDPAAVPALRAALAASDPYLSRLAYEALLKISPADAVRPS